MACHVAVAFLPDLVTAIDDALEEQFPDETCFLLKTSFNYLILVHSELDSLVSRNVKKLWGCELLGATQISVLNIPEKCLS